MSFFAGKSVNCGHQSSAFLRYCAGLGLVLWLAGCAVQPKITAPSPGAQAPRSLHIQSLWYRQSQSGLPDPVAGILPVVDKQRLFVADIQGHLIAMDRTTGQRLWQLGVAALIQHNGDINTLTGGLSLGGGLLLMGTSEGEVIALDAATGKPGWRSRLSSEILSPPVYSDGVVVVHVNDGRIFGLNAASGKRLWVYESSVPSLTLRGTSTPLIADERVFVGLANGKMVALSLREGQVIWETTVAIPAGRSELERVVDIDGDPVISKGVIFAAAYHGRVVAMSAVSGRILWSRDISAYHGLVVTPDQVYVSDDRNQLWALDRHNGAVLWKQSSLTSHRITRATIYRTMPVLADDAGDVYWLSWQDGHIITHKEFGKAGFSLPPLVADNMIYLKDRFNALYALQAEER